MRASIEPPEKKLRPIHVDASIRYDADWWSSEWTKKVAPGFSRAATAASSASMFCACSTVSIATAASNGALPAGATADFDGSAKSA